MERLNHTALTHRPVVGIMTGSFHTDYSRMIVDTISAALMKDGVGVCLFQGMDASRYLNLKDFVDDAFDHHYYARYEYSKFLQLDVLVISIGTISACPNPLSLQELLDYLPDIPLILLEDETDLPNGIHITMDNHVGMKACVDHLIEDHGCRNLVYISGPKGIADAELRLDAYRDSLPQHGIELREEMIAYGNFTDSVDDLIEDMLQRFPDTDAIICANDEMAESAYRVLRDRGVTPGKEVAVTGFDNNASGLFMDPPLTSVTQDYNQLAAKVAEAVQAYVRGERPESVTLPTQLVVRNSCGCTKPMSVFQESELSTSATIMENRMKMKQMMQDNMFSALMLRRLLHENITVHSFFEKLGNVLHALGAEHSWIALVDKPLSVDGSQPMFVPDELNVHMVQNDSDVQAFSRSEAPVIKAGQGNPYQEELLSNGSPVAVFPLFYAGYHYGVFMVEPKDQDIIFFYTLSLEIGTGLRYLYMALDQQDARRTLEEKNKILDYSASHDGLTGLYNRVGVMNQIYTFVRQHGKGHQFVAVMADLDHLKQINDTFGHDEGDQAIQTATRLLQLTLPQGSPLGRTGGDEFTGLFLLTDGYTPEWFCQQLRQHCASYNESSTLPYYEDISVGCFAFDYEQARDIPLLLKHADSQLYEAKKSRRASVIRPQAD